jgi:hypothetical protein
MLIYWNIAPNKRLWCLGLDINNIIRTPNIILVSVVMTSQSLVEGIGMYYESTFEYIQFEITKYVEIYGSGSLYDS